MDQRTPHLVVLAGPNGAGKSTAAPALLRGTLGVTEFVNADVIAQGLSAFEPERVAIRAGRVMLARLKQLAAERADFAFETTLASRSFAPWIKQLTSDGYAFHLVFLWLDSPDTALARVAERVRSGGHGIPEEVVRRRFLRGITNFFDLYRPLAKTWRVFNSSMAPPELIAFGGQGIRESVQDRELWDRIAAEATK
jgi:predicted ABC-type ATPase